MLVCAQVYGSKRLGCQTRYQEVRGVTPEVNLRNLNPFQIFYKEFLLNYSRWQILDQSECSSRCGEGYIIRRIKCMKRSQTGNDYIDDKYCAEVGPKPDVRISCHGMCLATHWAYTEWSEVGELYIARGTCTLLHSVPPATSSAPRRPSCESLTLKPS